jgi:outer membrane protein
MNPLRLLPLSLALSAVFCAPVHAQSLLQLVDAARGYDTVWQAAKLQLDAASSRAEQARAGLLPSVGLSAGVSRANTEVTRPPVDSVAARRTWG